MSTASNRLPVLQEEIRSAHEAAIAAAQTAVDRARDAGARLIEAKSLLHHGQWLPWLKETGVSPRTAQDYMQLARLPEDKYATVAHLGIRKALAEIANSKPTKPPSAETFCLPGAGCVTVGRLELGDAYISEAYIWHSAEHEGYFHVLSIMEYPANQVASTGIAGELICTKRPVRGDFVPTNLEYRGDILPDSLSWEIIRADTAGLEKTRRWMLERAE
jgi:hypothetical protein